MRRAPPVAERERQKRAATGGTAWGAGGARVERRRPAQAIGAKPKAPKRPGGGKPKARRGHGAERQARGGVADLRSPCRKTERRGTRERRAEAGGGATLAAGAGAQPEPPAGGGWR